MLALTWSSGPVSAQEEALPFTSDWDEQRATELEQFFNSYECPALDGSTFDSIEYTTTVESQGRLPDGVSVNVVLNRYNYRHLPKMMRFFYEPLGLDDLRVNFIRPEGRAEGDPALTPRYGDVVPVLMKAVLLNEYHFEQHFSFGGFPMCVLPAELLQSDRLMRIPVSLFNSRLSLANLARRHVGNLSAKRQRQFGCVPTRMNRWDWVPTRPRLVIFPRRVRRMDWGFPSRRQGW